ncbi:MAG: amidohydrolase family protein, partial [Acidimicrobiales bacterium]
YVVATIHEAQGLATQPMDNVYFDPCLYHQFGIDFLFEVIDIKNILFGSEIVGAVRGITPATSHYFDDTKRYVDALNLTRDEREQVYSKNDRHVCPRLDRLLVRQER